MSWIRVDRNSTIIESGAGAAEALKDHRALQIVGRRLVGRHAVDNRKLKAALIEADDLISRRKGRSPIPVILSDTDDLSIELCWISIADMMIVILLNDDLLVDRTIAKAGEAYGLSSTQMRVAGAIARGNDLNRTAEILGVQPNTIRTHVRRMFERVSVNSQAALMRALLSV